MSNIQSYAQKIKYLKSVKGEIKKINFNSVVVNVLKSEGVIIKNDNGGYDVTSKVNSMTANRLAELVQARWGKKPIIPDPNISLNAVDSRLAGIESLLSRMTGSVNKKYPTGSSLVNRIDQRLEGIESMLFRTVVNGKVVA